jgi:hypothetical protein
MEPLGARGAFSALRRLVRRRAVFGMVRLDAKFYHRTPEPKERRGSAAALFTANRETE